MQPLEEGMRSNSQLMCVCVCVCVCVCGLVFNYSALGSAAQSRYGAATRTCLLYTRQHLRVRSVYVLSSSSQQPLPRTTPAHGHLSNINSGLKRGAEV